MPVHIEEQIAKLHAQYSHKYNMCMVTDWYIIS